MRTDNVVFISYKSDDREKIVPYLKILEENNIPYWWDQEIKGAWGEEIERALEDAKIVLGFLSERSMNSTPVFVEFRRASSMGKLIPIKLDQAQVKYDFETTLGRLNYFDFSGEDINKKTAEKMRLLERLHHELGKSGIAPHTETPIEENSGNIFQWIQDSEKIQLIPYVIALAVFEGYDHDFVQWHASQLEKKLMTNRLDRDLFHAGKIIPKSEKLEKIKASIINFKGDSLPYPIEYVKFNDNDFKKNFLEFAWAELDQLKAPLIEWLNEIIETSDEALEQVAFALSLIAQKHFNSIYLLFIKRWLSGRNDRQIRCADLALSLMTANESIKGFVKSALFKLPIDEPVQFTDSIEDNAGDTATGNSAALQEPPDEIVSGDGAKIAIRLACGYTGLAMPEISIGILKRIENEIFNDPYFSRHKESLIGLLAETIEKFTKRARTERYALALLKIFIRDLVGWISLPESEKISYLPEYIGLVIMKNTRATSASNSLLSLDQFVDTERSDFSTLNALAALFDNAFTSQKPELRELAKSIIDNWCDEISGRKIDKTKHGVFEGLIRAMHRIAKTQDDRDRIVYSVRHILNF